MNQTTTPPTIPHIAEILRTYVNSSNDAPRLIVEHILPVIGVNVDTVGEIQGAGDRIETLKTLIDNTRRRLTRLASNADFQRQLADDAYDRTDDRFAEDALLESSNTFRNISESLEEIATELDEA